MTDKETKTKKRLTLRWSLTLGVAVVLLPFALAMIVIFHRLVSQLDDDLIQLRHDRGAAAAETVATDIVFDVLAGQADETLKKISTWIGEHPDGEWIIVLDAKGETFSQVHQGKSETIEPQQLKELAPEQSTLIGDLLVAKWPIRTSESGEVSGQVLYAESLKEHNETRTRTLFLLFLAMTAGFFFVLAGVFFVGHRTSRPIVELVAGAQRIASGDLSQAEVQSYGFREVQLLSSAVATMSQALQRQVATIKAMVTDLSGLTTQTATNMAQLSTSAAEQAAAVSQTASTVEEMEQSGQRAENIARQIVDSADKTTEVSIRGREAVETSSRIMVQIKDDSQQIAEKSRLLLTQLEEVGNAVSSVNGIAEQSKILAVNASIEAAKAGQYGSGFAVVAQEVKDLAQQSKEATFQITGSLFAIRQAIEAMVGMAQAGEDRTADGAKVIRNAGAIVNDLSEAIRENSDFANVIATTVNQQTAGLTQIATAIDEINKSATENQTVSKTVEQSAREVLDTLIQLEELTGNWRTRN